MGLVPLNWVLPYFKLTGLNLSLTWPETGQVRVIFQQTPSPLIVADTQIQRGL